MGSKRIDNVRLSCAIARLLYQTRSKGKYKTDNHFKIKIMQINERKKYAC